jgi:putative membrane protein
MDEQPAAGIAAQFPAQFPGIDGFLGTRGSFMLDVVFLAMFVVVPVMLFSINLVRSKKNYDLHKKIQLTLGIVLLAAVTLFEIDMRVNGWTERAAASPHFNLTADGFQSGLVQTVLWIHLYFAVTTAVLWVVVIVRAVRNFPSPPAPNEHSRWHLRWAKIAAVDMICTSVTGWTFYYLASVAT